MTKLTEHFTLEEFTKSTVASKLKIDNSVPTELMLNIKLTPAKLELVRQALGKSIIITSGYRCLAKCACWWSRNQCPHARISRRFQFII